jgi:hypothetical protein
MQCIGGFAIAEAYCAILGGSISKGVSSTRRGLRLKDDILSAATVGGALCEHTLAFLDESRARFSWSWRSIVIKSGLQFLRDRLQPSERRVDMTLYVPAEKMRIWRTQADADGVRVTERDLLTALIFKVCSHRFRMILHLHAGDLTWLYTSGYLRAAVAAGFYPRTGYPPSACGSNPDA